jgi:hypothetical protein
MGKPGRVIRLADAQAAIPGAPGPHFADLLKHGTLLVKLSFPLIFYGPPGGEAPLG